MRQLINKFFIVQVILFLLSFNYLTAQCVFNSNINNNPINNPKITSSQLNIKYKQWSTKIDSIVGLLNSYYNLNPKIFYQISVYNAFADPNSRNMIIGTALMDTFLLKKEGFKKFMLVISHEYSHLLQFQRNDKKGEDIFTSMYNYNAKPMELQADFLASYVLCHNNFVSLNDSKILYETAESLGDYKFFDSNHHGTRIERNKAVEDAQYFCNLTDLENVFEVSYSKIKPSLTYTGTPRLMGNFNIPNYPIIFLNSDYELLIQLNNKYINIGSTKGDNDTVGVFFMDFDLYGIKRFKVKLGKVYGSNNKEIGIFNFTGGITPVKK